MFFRGKLDGQGTFVSLDEKESYVGTFRMGKRHGQGRYIFRNGDVYEGEWLNDEMAGYEIYKFSQLGEQYCGKFLHRKRHGRGKYQFSDGSYQMVFEREVRE